MAETRFNRLIHGENRLQICAILAPISEVEFKVLKEKLAVSDSVLSKHIKALEDANYVNVAKRTDLGRKRTWLSLTREGRQAYAAHIQTLKDIIGETRNH